jgi:Ketopantoate reductase PanE/ApbA C terminal
VYGTCSALVQYPLPAFLLDDAVEGHVIPQLRAMMLEVIAVGRAMGFDEKALPLEAVDNIIRTTAEIHTVPGTTHRASTLLDRDNGRPMEVEVLIGELVKSAREHHVDAPVRHSHNYLQETVEGSRTSLIAIGAGVCVTICGPEPACSSSIGLALSVAYTQDDEM